MAGTGMETGIEAATAGKAPWGRQGIRQP